jgi:hypothetical protein
VSKWQRTFQHRQTSTLITTTASPAQANHYASQAITYGPACSSTQSGQRARHVHKHASSDHQTQSSKPAAVQCLWPHLSPNHNSASLQLPSSTPPPTCSSTQSGSACQGKRTSSHHHNPASLQLPATQKMHSPCGPTHLLLHPIRVSVPGEAPRQQLVGGHPRTPHISREAVGLAQHLRGDVVGRAHTVAQQRW